MLNRAGFILYFLFLFTKSNRQTEKEKTQHSDSASVCSSGPSSVLCMVESHISQLLLSPVQTGLCRAGGVFTDAARLGVSLCRIKIKRGNGDVMFLRPRQKSEER